MKYPKHTEINKFSEGIKSNMLEPRCLLPTAGRVRIDSPILVSCVISPLKHLARTHSSNAQLDQRPSCQIVRPSGSLLHALDRGRIHGERMLLHFFSTLTACAQSLVYE